MGFQIFLSMISSVSGLPRLCLCLYVGGVASFSVETFIWNPKAAPPSLSLPVPPTEEIVLKIFGNIWILWDIRKICTRNPIRSNRKTVRSLRSKYFKYDLLRERHTCIHTLFVLHYSYLLLLSTTTTTTTTICYYYLLLQLSTITIR